MHGPFLILCGALCFSTSGFAQAVAPEGATPYVVACVRMLIGGLALFLWCLAHGHFPSIKGCPTKNFIASVLAVLVFQVSFFSAVKAVGVAIGTVVAIGSTPIAAAILGYLFFKERPCLAWYPATAIAIAGLILINGFGSKAIDPLALLLPITAGASYAVFIAFSRKLTERQPPDGIMAVIEISVGLLLTPVFFLFPTDWLITPKGIFIALHLGIVTAAMAFAFCLAGFKSTSASTGSTLSLAEPLGAACLGIFVLHEPLSLSTCTGIILMFAGVLLLIFFPHLRPPQRHSN